MLRAMRLWPPGLPTQPGQSEGGPCAISECGLHDRCRGRGPYEHGGMFWRAGCRTHPAFAKRTPKHAIRSEARTR